MTTTYPPAVLLIGILVLPCRAELHCRADPDRVSSGISWNGTTWIRVGDALRFGGLLVGGMVEVRNERRYNQGLLPNHNWRGHAVAARRLSPKLLQERGLSLTFGIEHESAHPTMGIRHEPECCWEVVYDGSFRRFLMNSLLLRPAGLWSAGPVSLTAKADYQFYFYSKNTPELATQATGSSHGIGGCVQGRLPIGPAQVFVSAFDRYIFAGSRRDRGEVPFDQDTAIVVREVSRPVINAMNTVSLRAGCDFELPGGNRLITLYAGFLHGNIFGFVDSREVRTVWSVGVDIGY